MGLRPAIEDVATLFSLRPRLLTIPSLFLLLQSSGRSDQLQLGSHWSESYAVWATAWLVLCCAELPIPCISQTGKNESYIIQSIINSGEMDGYVRVGRVECADPFGCGDDANKLYL